MNMKKFIFYILSNLFLILNINFCNQLFAQSQWGIGPELLIRNAGSSGAIDIKIFPIGAVYNSSNQYSPRIRGDELQSGFPYLVGFDATLFNTSDTNNRVLGQFDGLATATQCHFAFGLGLYKLEFYWSSQTELLNYCYIDWRDANVYINPAYPSTDLAIEFYSVDSVNFYWAVQAGYPPLNIDDVNKYIKLWEFKGSPMDTLNLIPSKGIFTLDPTNNNGFLKLPINYNLYNGNLGHVNPGDLGMNFFPPLLVFQKVCLKKFEGKSRENANFLVTNNKNSSPTKRHEYIHSFKTSI